MIDSSRIQDVQEIAGHGVHAIIDGQSVFAGNTKLMELEGITYSLYFRCRHADLHCR